MLHDLRRLSEKNTIVLIGIAATNKFQKDIVIPESIRDMESTFGKCDLTDSYSILTQMGCENICVVNIENKHDCLDVTSLLAKYDFGYIVPLDIHASDVFYNPLRDGKKTFYAQYMMERFANHNDSYVIVTDKHASLYQDVDAFLEDMEEKREALKQSKNAMSKYENIIFVANNIERIMYSSVYLAGMMAVTPVDQYPSFNNPDSVKAVFDIDTCDVQSDLIYFKNHINGNMTVENLLNLDSDISPIKIEFLHRIQKYILNDMDYSEHIGCLYSAYRLKEIERQTIKYFESYMGWLITSYVFKSIYAKENPDHPGTVDIILKTDVTPIGCTEQFEVVKKIENRYSR